MSLDVYLNNGKTKKICGTGIFIREKGQTKELSLEEAKERYPNYDVELHEYEEKHAYHANITHNLNEMAEAAGIYKALWRPEEIGIKYAGELIPVLTEGLNILKSDPKHFKQFNPKNGWGTYEGLVTFIENYMNACKEYPDATVEANR